MNAQDIALIGAAALLPFWALGAYNRLMASRNAIGAAWSQFDEALQRRSAAVTGLIDGLREPLGVEALTVDSLQQAGLQLDAAAETLRRRPVDAARARALAAAEAPLSAALGRVLALLELHAAVQADAAVAPHLAALRDAAPRLAFARQLFNDAVVAYNAALHQFPTRLVARLFGFVEAGAL